MLTENEIENLITKLRNKYDEYASKYSPHWFNKDAFEERLQTALRNKFNLEAFIVAEIAHFETLRKRYDEKKRETSFSKKVDALIQELTAKIKKYPKIEFHPKAHFEIMHMYGACNELLEYYFPVLWIILDDRTALWEFEQQLQYLCAHSSNRFSRRIEDHITLLQRPHITYIEIEKDKNEYLKECAFVLHKILQWLDTITPTVSNNQCISFAKLYVHEEKRKRIIALFHNDTPQSAVKKIHSHILGIIEDFRLQAFRKD
ncbi:MAG: hypothetical protein N3F66_03215 [Spirochaetes bacterium]|nr:hypothetical protein [Spirochaetota bacterium]